MLHELFDELFGYKERQRDVEKRDAFANEDDRGEFDIGKHEGNPWVHGGLAQTSKGLAKGEIADDIKGTVVIPGVHIDGGLATVCFFMQSLDEQVDVPFDQRLLFHHCRGREAVR